MMHDADVCEGSGALVCDVDAGSPAGRAGLRPGTHITHVGGEPVLDAIDWLWLTDGFRISLEGFLPEGTAFSLTVERELGEQWGVSFSDCIFDALRTCHNACTFCFMRMLPAHMRPALYVRDDDYRLSFLQGNFVTLTNLTDADIDRIISHSLTPLHVSLHAVDAQVRRALMGPRHARGLQALEALLEAGVEAHVQIVLVPHVNDGEVLGRTLSWIEAHPGILSVGIVPLGFTDHQTAFTASFNEPQAARAVIEQLRPFQERAREQEGITRFHLADEWYLNAYPDDLYAHLPQTEAYDAYPQFENGIGFIRSFADEWQALAGRMESLFCGVDSTRRPLVLVCGEAFAAFVEPLFAVSATPAFSACLRLLVVHNDFFGGNVDVLGLLTGQDVVAALNGACEGCAGDLTAAYDAPPADDAPGTVDVAVAAGDLDDATAAADDAPRILLPAVMFNAEGFTLDDMTAGDISARIGEPVCVVSYVPESLLDCLESLLKPETR